MNGTLPRSSVLVAFSDRAARPSPRARAVVVLRLLAREAGPGVRRVSDVLVAGAALLCLAPLLLVTALAVVLTSRGPVLFRQTRVGKDGRTFAMLKLRTMFTGADAQKAALERAVRESRSGVRFKLRRDPRVTPIGRVLRKLSIDELPQLWNVLRGDMTLIGPRPALPREVALYDARALRRLEVLPGLTCHWQIRGRSDIPFEQQVELDLEYVDRTRWTEELSILLRTIPAVLTGRGAY